MNSTLLIQRMRAGLLAGALVVAAGCDRTDLPAANSSSAPLRIGLEVSSLDAAPSSRIAVAITGMLSAPDRLGGLQGTLRMDVAGLAPRTVILAFDVVGSEYARSLRYMLDAAATTDVRPLTSVTIADRAVLAADLSLTDQPRRLTLADWDARFSKDGAGEDRPMETPGQYLLNLRYGDANLSGNLNVFDFTYIANVAVGNQEIIIGTDAPSRDAVVAGNVFPVNNPGLGEPGDANPPGREANGNRQINIFDALAIANEA